MRSTVEMQEKSSSELTNKKKESWNTLKALWNGSL